MRKLKILAAAVAAFGMLLGVSPVSAAPGDYWLDVCNRSGADEIVYEHFKYEITCSSDPWVQGYGANGVEVWVYAQVRVYNPQGQQVAEFNDGLRPTGVTFTPGTTNVSEWVGAEYDVIIIDEFDGDEICISGFCNPDLPGIPVVIPRDAWVDSDQQQVWVKRDGWVNWVIVDICMYPFPGSPHSCSNRAVRSDVLGDDE